jgi:hypothetical protein
MDTKERLEVYKAVFETWRFEVNSHWQRVPTLRRLKPSPSRHAGNYWMRAERSGLERSWPLWVCC